MGPDPDCPHGHVDGLHGWTEGEATRVSGIGECITVVFERASRTAMLCTPADALQAPSSEHRQLRKA